MYNIFFLFLYIIYIIFTTSTSILTDAYIEKLLLKSSTCNSNLEYLFQQINIMQI